MSRLLFIQNLEYEFLGPMYISAMLKSHGHECEVTFGRDLGDISAAIDRFKPDRVGFSIMTGSHRWALNMAKSIKQEYDIQNIFGGAHPTFFPQFDSETKVVDAFVRGEGEESVLELMDHIDKKKPVDTIPNLYYKTEDGFRPNALRSLRSDLDDYPFPDRSLYDTLHNRLDRTVRNVITSRGCPFHCSFCFEDAMRDLYTGKGKYVRIRRIEKVIEECLTLKAEHDVRVIYFADDVFGMNKKWLYEFLPIYKKEIGLDFVCLVRADIVASDDEYAFRLAEGGCRSVFFGIESGNEALRNLVLKKQLSDAHIIRAAKLLHQAGVQFRTYNMMGLPDETLEDAFSTISLNINIKTDYPWCSVFSPFPGTELSQYAQDRGYLPASFDPNELAQSFFLASDLNSPVSSKLENLQKFFQTAVLWPRSLPLIKILIKLPPNVLFKAWFGLIYFWVYIKSEKRRFWITLIFALKSFRHVLSKQ